MKKTKKTEQPEKKEATANPETTSIFEKSFRIPIDFTAALVFALFAVGMLLLMPSQIKVGQNEVVNGRNFSQLLMVLILIGSVLICGQETQKIIKKKPIAYKTIDLGTELRALVIMGILFGFHLINVYTGLFVVGGCFSSMGFLLFFKCKKPLYYVITLGMTVGIWALFRYFLNVRF